MTTTDQIAAEALAKIGDEIADDPNLTTETLDNIETIIKTAINVG